jgi:signal transduction histidine kinase
MGSAERPRASPAGIARLGLRAIGDASPIPAFTLGSDHRIIHWNRALERLSGLCAATMIGSREQWRAFYPEERPVLADLILQGGSAHEIAIYYPTGRPSPLIEGAYEAEGFFPALGEEGTWLFFTAAPLHDEAGELIGAIETLQDVSEQKRAEGELRDYGVHLERHVAERTASLVELTGKLKQEIAERQSAERALAEKAAKLEQVNEELSQYAFVVSHDLRAPLRAIRNYVDFLEDDLARAIGPEQQQFFGGLRRALRHGDHLVDHLLDYSRVGRVEPRVDRIRLHEFLRDLMPTLKLPPDVDLAISSPAEEWPIVRADQTLLRQVFINLLLNGIKYNRAAQKKIELAWKIVAPGTCEVLVRDNGIGIDAKHHEQIFRMFYRLHTQTEFEGTGIGLAIVKKAIRKMGGDVRVASAPGEGSSFFLTLPLENNEETE